MYNSLPPRVYADLIGRPFRKDARGPDAYDCMGLFVLVQRRLGRAMPDYPSLVELAFLEATKQAFDLIPAAGFCPGDAILFRSANPRWHVGTVICVELPSMIHCQEGSGVCIERFDREGWYRRIEGFYRWKHQS